MLENRRITIRNQILATFLVLVLFVALTGFVGFNAVSKVGASADRLVEHDVAMSDASMEMVIAVEKEESALHGYMLGDEGTKAEFESAASSFDEWASKMERLDLTEDQQQRLTNLKQIHDERVSLATAAMTAKTDGNTALATQKMHEVEEKTKTLQDGMKSFEEYASEDMAASIERDHRIQRNSEMQVIGLAGLATLLGGGLGIVLSRRISRPVQELQMATVAISEGDFGERAQVSRLSRDDELADMAIAFDRMRENLAQSLEEISAASSALKTGDLTQDVRTDMPGVYGEVMQNLDESVESLESSVTEIQAIADSVATETGEVTSGAEEIESASEDVARTIEQISAGAEDQHEHLDTVASEMNDLSATVEEIAASSDEVAQTSQMAVERGEQGKSAAEAGLEAMDDIESKVVDATADMTALEAKMDQINDVVELIDSIAQQTNLLALNASIEAAGAGEAGEGFGVVASEIKALADETAAATKEVESQIADVQASTVATAEEMEQVQDHVEDGKQTVQEGLGALDDIVETVQSANDGVQSISDATDEQASSSQEVVAMVDEVTAVSQQTTAEAQNVSAAAEEQTAAITQIADNAESMSERASELQSLIEQFELEVDGFEGPVSEANVGEMTVESSRNPGDESGVVRPVMGDGGGVFE